MKITILGSGTSTGVPEIGCTCPVCISTDKHNKRLRASALIETNGNNILIDCGPDFREQMLGQEFKQIDGVLITHEHYDHVGGIDDLRPFCKFGQVPLYAEQSTATQLQARIPYCFGDNKYPGVPNITINQIEARVPFQINGTTILPFRVMHGKMPIVGYRIENIAYITDMLTMPIEEIELLEGLDCLIMNALRHKPHFTHQTLEQAMENAKLIGAKQTYFIHMNHHIGLHSEVEKSLPDNIHLSYDGLVIKP